MSHEKYRIRTDVEGRVCRSNKREGVSFRVCFGVINYSQVILVPTFQFVDTFTNCNFIHSKKNFETLSVKTCERST